MKKISILSLVAINILTAESLTFTLGEPIVGVNSGSFVILESIEPTPSPFPTPSSGGGGSSSSITTYTPYVAPIVIAPEVKSGNKLEILNLGVQEVNIEQKDSSNPNEQIFNNIETLSDGKKADTQIKLSDKEFNLNVSITGNKKSNETNVKAPANIEVTMDNSGNSTLKIDESIEVTAKRDGKIEVKHKDLNIKVQNSGANVEISENKTITITKENTTIEIKINGEIKAYITNSNGVKYDFNFPTNSNNKGAIIEDGALVGEYKALSNFFIVKDKNYKRGVTYGTDTVEIIPLSGETRFEERLYLDKSYRGIILRDGSAEILIDSQVLEMQQDKEYVIIIQTVEIEKPDLNRIYNTQNMDALYMPKGWNLISSPINRELSVTDVFGTNDVTYKFQNNSWIKNPQTLKPNEGMWIKYNFNIYVHFNEYDTKESYEFNTSKLTTGWNLVGSGADITLTGNYENIWAFDNVTKEWINKPNKILRGYVFWIKK